MAGGRGLHNINKFCRKKTLRKDFLYRSMPLLTIGMILIYMLGIVCTYLMLERQIGKTAEHLIDAKKHALLRVTNLMSMIKKIGLQNAVNYNYIFVGKTTTCNFIGLFGQVLNGKVMISSNFKPETVGNNFEDFRFQVGKNKSYSQWYVVATTK